MPQCSRINIRSKVTKCKRLLKGIEWHWIVFISFECPYRLVSNFNMLGLYGIKLPASFPYSHLMILITFLHYLLIPPMPVHPFYHNGQLVTICYCYSFHSRLKTHHFHHRWPTHLLDCSMVLCFSFRYPFSFSLDYTGLLSVFDRF